MVSCSTCKVSFSTQICKQGGLLREDGDKIIMSSNEGQQSGELYYREDRRILC